MHKKAVAIHSGGMDSSLCLALAIKEFCKEDVISLSFAYEQRHSTELIQAAKICEEWNVDHQVIRLDAFNQLTTSALLDKNMPIEQHSDKPPNTMIIGRNGLMAQLGGIYADHLGANCIYLGVMELEGANSGYRDCSRYYMDLQQEILRIDTGNANFEIRTPLVHLSKLQTMEKAHEIGVLSYLLQETITCYEGIKEVGCQICPACLLRNQGLAQFAAKNPSFILPFVVPSNVKL